MKKYPDAFLLREMFEECIAVLNAFDLEAIGIYSVIIRSSIYLSVWTLRMPPVNERFQAINEPSFYHLVLDYVESYSVVLCALPEEERFECLLKKDGLVFSLINKALILDRDFFKQVLNLIPENQRLSALMNMSRSGYDVFHSVVMIGNLVELKTILDMLPMHDRHVAATSKGNISCSIFRCAAGSNEIFNFLLESVPMNERLCVLTEQTGADNTGHLNKT